MTAGSRSLMVVESVAAVSAVAGDMNIAPDNIAAATTDVNVFMSGSPCSRPPTTLTSLVRFTSGRKKPPGRNGNINAIGALTLVASCSRSTINPDDNGQGWPCGRQDRE